MKLNDIAYYVKDKVPSTQITLEQYITTDNLLPQKGGRVRAVSLPPNKCSLTHYQKGDVLVANIRPYLQKIWYADIEGGASPDVLVFRAKEGHNSQYVYACLLQDAFFNFVMKAPIGAKMPRGEKNHILRFPIVPIDNEETVGKILSNIDRKIALNRAMNEELEAMARQLYDYWFLQFDFPDANGNPYRSSGGKMVYNDILKREIPQGWEVKSVQEIESNIVTGKTPSTSDENNFGGDIPFITIDDIRGNLFVGKTARTLSESGAQSQKGKYIPTGSLCCTCIGTIGLLGFAIKPSHTNQQINSIIFSNPSNAEYMYFALDDFFKNSTVKTGNTFKNMNKAEFADINIIKPCTPILSSFHFSIMPVFEQICINIEEIIRLRSLRDELLPLMMNGQVEIKK